MWQKVYEDLNDPGFEVMAVAMDTPEAARPWVEAAKPTYTSLVDRDHHVAQLFNMVNVPEAVWIDERGRIVRPAENAGSYDGFRKRDRSTGVMPAEAAELTARAKSIYVEAVRDWAIHGDRSRHVLDAAKARQQMRPLRDETALAHAHFRLGCHLQRIGKGEAAVRHFEEARRLHPESWNIWRQTAGRNEQGFAAGPDFWQRVDSLGARRYYERVNLDGMP